MRTRHLIAAIISAIALLGLSSCQEGSPSDLPPLLAEADEAYMKGRYTDADSLMAEYRRHPVSSERADNYCHLLLLLKEFFDGNISERHFSKADSLVRYYQDGEEGKLAKAQLILGAIYQKSKRHPEALHSLLEAYSLAERGKDSHMACIISRTLGDVYFSQRMLDDCIPYYRAYYHLAAKNSDSLRLAYASLNMGKVYTIIGDADSAECSYKQAMAIAKGLPQEKDIVDVATYKLCDIYIQTGRFADAERMMPRNELNDENWAYWHYKQHHTDSALYYFNSMLGKYGWQAESEYLRNLAEIENQRNNPKEALHYYSAYADAIDSIKHYSQIEETSNARSQFYYNALKEERNRLEAEKKSATAIAVVAGLLTIILTLAAIIAWKAYRHKKNAEIERERQLKKEEKARHEISLQQLEQNKQRLAELEQLLSAAREKGDTSSSKQIELESEILETQTLQIEAARKQAILLEEKLRRSDIFKKIKENAGKQDFALREDDWQQLFEYINSTYNNFTLRLIDIANLKGLELQVCCLLKIDVQPVDIALLVNRQRSSINMMCKRIYKKIFHKEGSAKDFYRFIEGF